MRDGYRACGNCGFEVENDSTHTPYECLSATRREVDRLTLQVDELKAQDEVRSGRWCLGNMAEGRGPCGVCPKCSKANFDRAEYAELQNQELQKVVDAAVEWWADPHDTTKTIVDLQNEVEAYWEKHKTEKRYCEECHQPPGIHHKSCSKCPQFGGLT